MKSPIRNRHIDRVSGDEQGTVTLFREDGEVILVQTGVFARGLRHAFMSGHSGLVTFEEFMRSLAGEHPTYDIGEG